MSRILQTKENQITQKYSNEHKGIDIVGKNSTLDNIVAHTQGKVVFCQTGLTNDTSSTGNASYGNCVKLKHNNGYYTLYAHMNMVNVSLNDIVNKGQIIGYMGDSGKAFGAHVHFEVRNANDEKIDPTNYIDNELPDSDLIKKWQKAMNDSFNCGLEEDNLFGPISQSEITNNNFTIGTKGEIVKWLQSRLIELGFDCGPHGMDGSFGPDTLDAVKKFQQSKGIKVDGIVGLNTTIKLLE